MISAFAEVICINAGDKFHDGSGDPYSWFNFRLSLVSIDSVLSTKSAESFTASVDPTPRADRSKPTIEISPIVD